jgi:2-iminobutanoate/2-iminopropanoate deaminase
MTERKTIATSAAPQAIGPYAQAICVQGPANLLFTSGQVALDPETGALITGDVRAQTLRVMRNLQSVLEAGSSSFGQVVKATIFLKDMGDFQAVNEVYGSFFEADNVPARSTVEVSRLPKDVDVEIEMVAVSREG